MLVLSRKVGERILIGDDIVVTIVRISQGTVRIGVEAPRQTSVVREEVVVSLDEAESSFDSSLKQSTGAQPSDESVSKPSMAVPAPVTHASGTASASAETPLP